MRGVAQESASGRSKRRRFDDDRSRAGSSVNELGARAAVRRSVVTRVLWSYAFVVLAFSLVAGWSALGLRRAADEAALMRGGYYPLALVVRDLAAKQDIYNSQLNHITSARNPADLRVWFDFALKIGRPKMFGQVRSAIASAFFSSGATDDERV